MEEKKERIKVQYQTGTLERWGYGFYNLGQNFIYSMVNTYLMTFLLMRSMDTALIASIMLVVKVWDAVNDAIFGGIVDKMRFKNGGKFMPWIRISLIFIPLATILLFAMPSGIPAGMKAVWLAVAYILWDTAYTICDVPNFGLVTTMTTSQTERTTLMTIGRLLGTLGAIGVMVLVPVLIGEGVGLSFTVSAIIVSVIALLTMAPLAWKGTERVKTDTSEAAITIKDMMKYLFSNKYLLIISAAVFISNGLNTAQTVAMFAAFYLFNDATLASIIMLMAVAPVLLIGGFIPTIMKKVDKFTFYFWSTVGSAVLSFVIYFIGYSNLTLHIVLLVLRGFCSGGLMLQFMFTPDCAEYGRYKTGIDARGIAFATQTFTAKLRAAVTSVLGVAMLGWFGWQTVDADSFADLAASGVTQTPQAINGLWITYALIPAIGMGLTVLIILAYKLRDKDVELMARCNNGEITREECEAQLSRKY